MPTVYKRAAAWQDLVECYAYLAENASQNIAERFLPNAEASFADLSEHPLMGAPLTLRRPQLASMRKWQVKEFNEILIFYSTPTGLRAWQSRLRERARHRDARKVILRRHGSSRSVAPKDRIPHW